MRGGDSGPPPLAEAMVGDSFEDSAGGFGAGSAGTGGGAQPQADQVRQLFQETFLFSIETLE